MDRVFGRLAAIAAWIAFCSISSASGMVVYVDDDAALGGDGQSWATAYRYLQDAFSAARNDSSIAEIHVAEGLYRPDLDEVGEVTLGGRGASFALVDGVAVRGGYAGIGADNPDYRDWSIYKSILSGDLAGDDESDFVNYDDNSVHVVSVGQGVGNSTIVEGFTITAGYANGDVADHGAYGGGVCLYIGSNDTPSSPLFLSCDLLSNWAKRGGGVYANFGARPVIDRCTFAGNMAEHRGGGMECEHQVGGTQTAIANCVFRGNNAGSAHGGGAIYNNEASPTVVNCLFSANTSESDGGGIRSMTSSKPLLTNCTFFGNTAVRYGGAIAAESSSVHKMANTIVWGNSASDFSQIYGPAGSAVEANHCCVEGWADDDQANIGSDPLFVNTNGPDGLPGTDDDDFRFTEYSPCIDVGSNGAVPTEQVVDLGGAPRIADGDTNGLAVVDMGAFEYYLDCNGNDIPDVYEADFDGDGVIDDCDPDVDGDSVANEDDVCDYSPAEATVINDPQHPFYGTHRGTIRGDLDGDCDCDLADFAIMADDITGPNPPLYDGQHLIDG